MSITNKILIIGVISFVLISANIGGYSIYIVDEARNAQCAREMLENGDLVVPTFNQTLRTDKPPLHYYFMILGYSIFGVNPFAARIFSVIFGVATVLLTLWFVKKFRGLEEALYTSFILLSYVGFIVQFHLATPDPYLIFFVLASILFFFSFFKTADKSFLYLMYISIALGVLSKGPIAIVLPGGVIFFFLLIQRGLSSLFTLRPILGLFLILLVALPWYILVHIKTGGAWTEDFFLDHNISRFISPKEGHGGIFILPILYLIALTLPFSVFLPQAIIQNLRKDDLGILAIISVTFITAFFMFASTKLPNYISPALPFTAILIAPLVSNLELKKRGRRISVIVLVALSIAILLAVKFAIPHVEGLSSLEGVFWFFLPMLLGALSALILEYLNRSQLSIITLGFGFILFHQLFFYFLFPKVDDLNPVQKTSKIVNESPQLVYYKRMNQGYPFLLGREVEEVSIEQLRQMTDRGENFTLITREKYLEELMDLQLTEITREIDLFDGTTTVLMRTP